MAEDFFATVFSGAVFGATFITGPFLSAVFLDVLAEGFLAIPCFLTTINLPTFKVVKSCLCVFFILISFFSSYLLIAEYLSLFS